MKEAELYVSSSNGRVKCLACARHCQMGEGQIGLCGIRQNLGGKLQLLSYGKLFTGHIDPIEKKPVSHYNPGSRIFSVATSGCSWLCHPAGTKILLADGSTKYIENLREGELVWSYNLGQNTKIEPSVVTHRGVRFGEILEISFGHNSESILELTSEHPVLTKEGWKEARNLGPDDYLMKVRVRQTEANEQKQLASTQSFAYKESSSIREGREKGATSENSAQEIKNGIKGFLEYPGHCWHGNVLGLRSQPRERQFSVQLELYVLLDELGLKYDKEYGIYPESKFAGSRVRYICDAAFPQLKLDIEVGRSWHQGGGVQIQDRTRDSTLIAEGWQVLRIRSADMFIHREAVKALILQRVKSPLMLNTREWLRVNSVKPTGRIEQVYGIETIPNHNYVADSVIVHNCAYCQNYEISQRRKIEGFDISPNEVPRLALNQACQGIAYTYNEPSIFIEFARDIGIEAHKRGLFNIFVSNGYDTPESVSLMKQFLDCITVDFKGSGETSFVRKYIGIPNADPIFETLSEIKEKTQIHVEITDLIVPKVGDSLEQAKKLCNWVYDNLGPSTPIHFLRFHPDYKMMEFPSTPVETLEKHHAVAKEAGLEYAYLGNVPGHKLEHTYCPGCHEVVVRRYGYEITGWFLNLDNKCNFCGHKISIEGKLAASVNEERFLPAYF